MDIISSCRRALLTHQQNPYMFWDNTSKMITISPNGFRCLLGVKTADQASVLKVPYPQISFGMMKQHQENSPDKSVKLITALFILWKCDVIVGLGVNIYRGKLFLGKYWMLDQQLKRPHSISIMTPDNDFPVSFVVCTKLTICWFCKALGNTDTWVNIFDRQLSTFW